MIAFLSFANTPYLKTLNRIGKEAKESSFFDKIFLRTEKDFSPAYWAQYKDFYLHNSRGYGYWLWKSYFINQELTSLQNGDYLIYLDAGCEVNKHGRKIFQEYLKLASENELGIVCFRNDNLLERWYTKGDIFTYFGVRDMSEFVDTEQMLAGVLVIYVNDRNRAIFSRWKEISHSRLDLLTDAPSVSPNLSGFIENRHDQSLFSVLMKSYGVKPRSGWEVQNHPATNIKLARLRHHPFLAIRNKSGEPRLNKLQRLFFPVINFVWYYYDRMYIWARNQYHKYV